MAGVDPRDLTGQGTVRQGLTNAFVVSLEIRDNEVAQYADVILPVAPQQEKSGAYVNWEGRVRPFQRAIDTQSMSDYRVLDLLAAEMGEFLGTRTIDQIRAEMDELGPWTGTRAVRPRAKAGGAPRPLVGEAILATWAQLLDNGVLQDGEPFLAGTRRPAVARMSQATASGAGVVDGDLVQVSTKSGAITLPVLITAMPDHVVWVPTNSDESTVRSTLDVDAGAAVALRKAGA